MADGASAMDVPLHADLLLVAQRRRGFFAKLTRRRLKRGVFRSVADLQAAINRFLDEYNVSPSPSHGPPTPTKSSLLSDEGISVRFDPLAKLMIRHDVGCRVEDTLQIKKIDEDFFE